MFLLGVSAERLEALLRDEHLGLEGDALFEFTDGQGTGYLIEHRREQGYRFLRCVRNRVIRSSGSISTLEETLEAAVGDLLGWLEPAQGDWVRSLRTTAQELRIVVERARAEATEWPIRSITMPVDSSPWTA